MLSGRAHAVTVLLMGAATEPWFEPRLYMIPRRRRGAAGARFSEAQASPRLRVREPVMTGHDQSMWYVHV